MAKRLVLACALLLSIGILGADVPAPAVDTTATDEAGFFPLPIVPPGACILPDGSCTVTLDTICRFLDGEFQGPNTECPDDATADETGFFPLPIVPPGACILPDGSCTVTLDTICRFLDGEFQGPNTECP